jgi:repressor LexA
MAALGVRVPLVGRVAAGVPILAKENIEEWITVDGLNATDNYFALHVRGDSMIEAGILDGDVVIARQQQVAENGDIVIALVDDEAATVKKFHRAGTTVSLIAMNPRYEPIVLRGDRVHIQGKVIELRRRLEQH